MGGAPRPPGAKRPKRWSGGLGTEPSTSGTQDGARQTHLPVQCPLVQLISGSNPAADLGGLLPGFEGELRRQDARQLLQGGTRSCRAALTGPALGGALSSKPAGPVSSRPQRPPLPPPTPRPGLSLLLPGAGPPPGASVRMAPPGRAAVGWGGGGGWGVGVRVASAPWLSAPPRSPHRLPQAEPPQLLQASFQPLLQGPLLLPHGVGQLLRGGHRAVGACWGQGRVLRTAGPGCLLASPSPAGDAQAGSQSHTCPDCGPATTVPCYSRKPARLPPPDGPGPLGGRAAPPALCGRPRSGFTPSHPTLHPRPLTAFSASSPLSLTRTHTPPTPLLSGPPSKPVPTGPTSLQGPEPQPLTPTR